MNAPRIAAIAVGVLFGVVGLGFWAAPDQAAQYFDLEAIGVSGLVALRADLGGLFLGLGVLCLAGAITRRRSLLSAAALILGAIAIGRVVGWIAGSGASAQLGTLAIEVAALAVLMLASRRLSASRTSAPRTTLRPWLVVSAIVIAVGVGLAATSRGAGADLWLFEQGAAKLTARDNAALLGDDALRVAICGSSAPLPSPTRAKSCVGVFAGGKFYLVDVGPESVENLVQWAIPLSRIGGVLLTHFHSDHIGDLGEVNLQTWAQGRPGPLAVYGGPGVEEVVAGFNRAYRLDQGYRTAHHTDRLMPAETWPLVAQRIELVGSATPERSRTGVVLDDGALRITAIEVDHEPVAPAVAYRFDYKGRSVVVSGDLKFHQPLATAAKGADVLVIEAVARPMLKALQNGAAAAGRDRQATILHDIQDYHVAPVEAARIANDAGVKLLVFYHLLPAPDTFLARRLFGQDLEQVRPRDWILADDGSQYTLPIGSGEVRVGQIGR